MDSGIDDLLRLASNDPSFAAAAVAAGSVRPEHVPWLARAGVSRLHVGASVRPGGSWTKSHTDAGFVRSWRLLLDDAVAARGMRSGRTG
jgi:copper homeostasis protein